MNRLYLRYSPFFLFSVISSIVTILLIGNRSELYFFVIILVASLAFLAIFSILLKVIFKWTG